MVMELSGIPLYSPLLFVQNLGFCKVHFTKFTKKSFFLIAIRYISQKYIIFASRFKKNAAKLVLIFKICKFMDEKILKKSVLTDSALIQLFYVGFKPSKRGIQYVYQIVTYFRHSNKVDTSEVLSDSKAIKLFNEMCYCSL